LPGVTEENHEIPQDSHSQGWVLNRGTPEYEVLNHDVMYLVYVVAKLLCVAYYAWMTILERASLHISLHVDVRACSARNLINVMGLPEQEEHFSPSPRADAQSILPIHATTQNTSYEWTEACTWNKCFAVFFSKTRSSFPPFTTLHGTHHSFMQPGYCVDIECV
jgi:hypothetical protein